MSQNYVSNEYPYGNFPSHYTKAGQAQLKKQWQENSFKSQNDANKNHEKENLHNNEHNKNNLDLHKLLPLIKKMNSNSPLTQGDLMGMFMNFIGKENKDLIDVFSVIANTQTIKSKDIKGDNLSSSKPKIETFKRIQ